MVETRQQEAVAALEKLSDAELCVKAQRDFSVASRNFVEGTRDNSNYAKIVSITLLVGRMVKNQTAEACTAAIMKLQQDGAFDLEFASCMATRCAGVFARALVKAALQKERAKKVPVKDKKDSESPGDTSSNSSASIGHKKSTDASGDGPSISSILSSGLPPVQYASDVAKMIADSKAIHDAITAKQITEEFAATLLAGLRPRFDGGIHSEKLHIENSEDVATRKFQKETTELFGFDNAPMLIQRYYDYVFGVGHPDIWVSTKIAQLRDNGDYKDVFSILKATTPGTVSPHFMGDSHAIVAFRRQARIVLHWLGAWVYASDLAARMPGHSTSEERDTTASVFFAGVTDDPTTRHTMSMNASLSKMASFTKKSVSVTNDTSGTFMVHADPTSVARAPPHQQQQLQQQNQQHGGGQQSYRRPDRRARNQQRYNNRDRDDGHWEQHNYGNAGLGGGGGNRGWNNNAGGGQYNNRNNGQYNNNNASYGGRGGNSGRGGGGGGYGGRGGNNNNNNRNNNNNNNSGGGGGGGGGRGGRNFGPGRRY